jgi:glutaredoxin-like YruB-family protein
MAKVTVYSTPTCPYCDYLKDFLKENKVEFTVVNVAEDREAAKMVVRETKQMGVPVTKIDDEWVIGFDKEKLKEILKLN